VVWAVLFVSGRLFISARVGGPPAGPSLGRPAACPDRSAWCATVRDNAERDDIPQVTHPTLAAVRAPAAGCSSI